MVYNVNGIKFILEGSIALPQLNLKEYETSDLDYKHRFLVSFKDDIKYDLPLEKTSPFIFSKEGFSYKCFHNKRDCLALIKYDENFKEIKIDINKRFSKNEAIVSYLFLGIMFMEVAMSYEYLAVHASALKYKDKVFLLSAPSGIGKSTLRANLVKLAKKMIVINDDKPLLEFNDDVWVFGSPFSGEFYLNTNVKEKLTHIFFLKQGAIDLKHSLTKDEKLKYLLKNIYKPKSDHLWDNTLKNLEQLADKISISLVEVTNSIDAAKYIINTLEEL